MNLLSIGNSVFEGTTRFLHRISKIGGTIIFIGGFLLEQREICVLMSDELQYNGENTGFYVMIKEALINRDWDYFNKTSRAKAEAEALKENDFTKFLNLVNKSGRSSYMYLQTVYAASEPKNQAVSLALLFCDELLDGKCAFRVHGGGFAGTVQVFVSFGVLDSFKNEIEGVFGAVICHIFSIRSVGGTEIKL